MMTLAMLALTSVLFGLFFAFVAFCDRVVG
ncbi:MAG: hypothetical protein JWM80_2111 [Cyanobacteria bacterium RYN_339]|nr:hypothetical protein [Cyanobacteria bacterium RYN_339]